MGSGAAAVCGRGCGFTVTTGILRCAALAGFGATLCLTGSGSAGGSLGVARQPASVVTRKTATKCLTLFSLFFARSSGQDVCDLGVGDRFHVAFDAAATVHVEFSGAAAARDGFMSLRPRNETEVVVVAQRPAWKRICGTLCKGTNEHRKGRIRASDRIRVCLVWRACNEPLFGVVCNQGM